jgi:ribulose-5-phosphate 4-epimerase/fuculose-1-phosphate aldolase
MMFMPRKSPALVMSDELFFVDFEKPVPQSSLHQAIYKGRADVKAVFHFHSPAEILLSVVGQNHSTDAQLQRHLLRRGAAL